MRSLVEAAGKSLPAMDLAAPAPATASPRVEAAL
jgi:hypothetical protein